MTASTNIVSRALAEIMEQTLRLPYSRSSSESLPSGEWAALRYFGDVRPTARSFAAYARYSRQPETEVSMIIEALEHRGYLRRLPARNKSEGCRIEVTPLGRKRLDHDPLAVVCEAIQELPDQQRYCFADSLRRVFQHVVNATAADELDHNRPNASRK